MSYRFRRDKDLRRLRPVKSARAFVLIVCEGEKTEPLYFKSLRSKLGLNTVEVEVEGDKSGSAPISVVDRAIILKKARAKSRGPLWFPYDVVWCVMDVDQHESLARALNKALANKLRVALTNPCFEYWYLLHFSNTNRLFQYNKHVHEELTKHISKYEKNSDKTFKIVHPHTKTAVERADQFEKNRVYPKDTNNKEDLTNFNSSTNVHLVVKLLYQIAGKEIE